MVPALSVRCGNRGTRRRRWRLEQVVELAVCGPPGGAILTGRLLSTTFLYFETLRNSSCAN